MILKSIKKHVLRSHFTVLRLFWLCFLLSAVISCTVLPKPPTEKIRGEWGSVVIAPARFTPATNFEAFAISKTKGVGKGATIGAGMGAVQAALLAVSFGGPSAVVIAPYLAVISVPAFATGGGVLGGFSSVTVEDAKAVNAIIQENLKALNIQTTLAELVAKSARNDVGLVLSIDKNLGPAVHKEKVDYSDQAQRGLGGVLEIATTEIGFDGAGKTLQFFMVVRARFIRPGDGEQLYDREFVYESDPYDGKKWAANNAALFEAELYRAYASIAESIVEQIFLMTTLPLETSFGDPNQKKSSFLSLIGGFGACGLAWRLPPREFCPTIFDFDMDHKEWNRFPEITTLTPTLEWEPFPRVIDQHPRYAALLNAVSNIRYDLRIWKVASDTPPQLVYERRTLIGPKHRLDKPLESGTHYFWSIRARFDVDGQTHSTRWGCYREPGYSTDKHVKMEARHSFQMLLSYQTFRDVCTLDFIPTANYYRFKTP